MNKRLKLYLTACLHARMEHLFPLEIWEHILHFVDDFPTAMRLIEQHPQLEQRYIAENRWKDLIPLIWHKHQTQIILDVGKELYQERYDLNVIGYSQHVICSIQHIHGYKTKYKDSEQKRVRIADRRLFIGDKNYKIASSSKVKDYLSLPEVLKCLAAS